MSLYRTVDNEMRTDTWQVSLSGNSKQRRVILREIVRSVKQMNLNVNVRPCEYGNTDRYFDVVLIQNND